MSVRKGDRGEGKLQVLKNTYRLRQTLLNGTYKIDRY